MAEIGLSCAKNVFSEKAGWCDPLNARYKAFSQELWSEATVGLTG